MSTVGLSHCSLIVAEFIKNTGILLEWAPTFKAMVVFVEHRYYGDSWDAGSWPFGREAFSPANVRYLTVEQAIADFAEVTLALRKKWRAPLETAVVTFGPSHACHHAPLWQPHLSTCRLGPRNSYLPFATALQV